jgi:hypothetical protein
VDKLRACFRELLGAAGQGHPVTEPQAVFALSAFLAFISGAQCLHALPSHSPSAQAKVGVDGGVRAGEVEGDYVCVGVGESAHQLVSPAPGV